MREAGVYCEILPYSVSVEEIQSREPKGLILSGGPSSVYDDDAPKPQTGLLATPPYPVLGICYGLQLMAHGLGGKVLPSKSREYGYARLTVVDSTSRLFAGLPKEMDVWMSHGDHVTELPDGFRMTAQTADAVNAFENRARRIYGLQFHPEVAHTPLGAQILRNFLFEICGCKGDWTPAAAIEEQTERIRDRLGENGQAICGLSGGVDSAVAAALVHRAVGDRALHPRAQASLVHAPHAGRARRAPRRLESRRRRPSRRFARAPHAAHSSQSSFLTIWAVFGLPFFLFASVTIRLPMKVPAAGASTRAVAAPCRARHSSRRMRVEETAPSVREMTRRWHGSLRIMPV